MAFDVPVGRSDYMALSDASIVEHAREPVEQLFLPAEGLAGPRLGFVLLDRSLRDSCRE